MELLMTLTAIISFIIFALTIIHFARKIKFNRSLSIDLSILVIGLSYLIFSAILFLWAFEFFNYNLKDFLIVYSVVLVVQTIALVNILHESTRNRKVFYSLLALLLIIPLSFLDLVYLHFLIPLSFFIILLSFLVFSNSHQKFTTLLITYSVFSLFSYLVSVFWSGGIIGFNFLSLIFFGFFMYFFLDNIRNHQKPFLPPLRKKTSPIVHLLRHFVFIIIITNFIFVGTVAIHELSHLVMVSASGSCENSQIVYEVNGLPHTEVFCEDESVRNIWIFAGMIIPAIVSILLFFVGGHSTKEIALQIFGFNLMISYIDLMDIGLSRGVSAFITFIGAALLVLSIILLAHSRTEH